MAAKKIEFVAKNVKAFSNWLKKFVAIDQSLLLEVDEVESEFIAKTYNEERSVVKFSKIKFDEAGFTVKPSKDPRRIKIGIYNIARLMKILNQFDNEEFAFTVNYDEISGETTEWAGLTLLLKNKNLKMTVDCTSLNIFKYISDKLFKDKIAALEDVVTEFDLLKFNIEQTNSLCSLDDDTWQFMEFRNEANVYVSGKNFDLLLRENPDEHDGSSQSINIFKEQFNSIDVEDYHVKMGEDRLIFTSDNENTIIVISMVEKD